MAAPLRLFVATALALLATTSQLHAFGFFGGNGLRDGARWDSEPRTVNGIERSLDGGLRFSVTGGSYQAFRDSFQWFGTPPPVADFRQAILDAFAAWQAVDPETGLGSDLTFVEDFSVAVTEDSRTTGAEIDVMAINRNSSGLSGFTFINWLGYTNLRLTSGARVRAQPVSGANIEMNNNPGARWNLNRFRTILAHEIGHAIGLRDVDVDAGPDGEYVDDNYDGTSATTAAATLTNSFALLIDPLNPSASPLTLYNVPNANPGFDSSGALVFMETSISSAFNTRLVPLTNDDFAGRQFLYPSASPVPRPAPDFYTTLEDVPLDVPANAPASSPVRLVPERSTWRYLDNGSNQQTAWRSPGFDDSSWKSNRAKFGDGDGNERTTILFGPSPNNAQNDPDQKFITTYFRHTFDASDLLSTSALQLRLNYDDGIAVYLNGNEIERQNLADNAGYRTLADNPIGGDDETSFSAFTIAPTHLRHGANTLAVELHQSDADSSDLGFDLSLDQLPAAAGVLANDTNPDGAPALDAQVEQSTSHGDLTLQPDGAFRYIPAEGFTGQDSFVYSVPLPNGGRTPQTVVLTVVPAATLAAADSDRDGTPDAGEAIAGTDPADPTDHLRIANIQSLPNKRTITWQAAAGRSYWLDFSTDLSTWTPVNTAPATSLTHAQIQIDDTDPTHLAAPHIFYRLRVSPTTN